jgi:hypothetical protein
MESDQIKRLSIDFRIIYFLSRKHDVQSYNDLKFLFGQFYYNFKILKQRDEPKENEFEQFFAVCMSKMKK